MKGTVGGSKEEKLTGEEKKYYGDQEGKWQAECDMRSLLEAAEIRADQKRHEAAKFCMKQKKKHLDKAIKEVE